MDEYEQEILKEEIFKEAQSNRVSEETIIIITKEGWVQIGRASCRERV